MRFNFSNLLLILGLSASFSCASPIKQRSHNKDPQAAASPTSSSKPRTTTTSTTLQATASSQPTAKAPPVLLSPATAKQAGGNVPGGPPPQTSFSANALSNFKVANFLEGVESGFFAGVLQTLNKDPEFTTAAADGKSMANITSQIAAQELVHKATLEGLLALAMESAVPSCATIYPVNNTQDFLVKANVVTGAAIGVIITILQSLSRTDPNLIGPLSSILSTESQQDTFFRMSGSNTPSPSPFNTGISTTFAYNIGLTYVDPHSCPQLLALPILPSMNLTSPVMNATAPATPPTSITFTASGVPENGKMYVGWVNQANPVVYTNVTLENGIGTAGVPKGLTGLAYAALTAQNSAQTVDGLTNATLAGPAVVLMS